MFDSIELHALLDHSYEGRKGVWDGQRLRPHRKPLVDARIRKRWAIVFRPFF
jgi:hypothetical protein